MIQASNSILRINTPTKEEFLNIWRQYQPFLIEGVAENWNACKNWSNDYLLKVCGNNTIPVEFHSTIFLNNYNYVKEDNYDRKKIKLKEYVDIISGNKKDDDLEYYMAQIELEKFFPELIRDIDYPEYLDRKALISFWFGSPGKAFASVSTLHFDQEQNVFVQIRGRKRILLFPPSNYLSFYPPVGERGSHAHFSKVNPINPNFELFPKFPWHEKIEVILKAGEMLYIPPFWWHHVTAIDENISLSFWYDLKIQDFLRQKRILSTALNILPHYTRHSISSLTKLRSIIKSFF
ncbi:MAG: cupin-like domain-containing protein [Spirirestis rafaelensis WJT71-NPBG6]|jgi:lysine-specific demethylase 8|nr:cupin-like domain-containing protein [Spirirestis rafaelensis WJT71-NPBG6]